MESPHGMDRQGGGVPRSRLRWAGMAALLSLAVVGWEYLLKVAMTAVDWNPAGVAVHLALDVALSLPVVAFALWAGMRLARRFGMGTGEWAGLLGVAGLVCLVFLLAMTPVVAGRDALHEWVGKTYALSLAEVQRSAQSDLAAQSRQLCSFASLSNPVISGDESAYGVPLLYRLQTGPAPCCCNSRRCCPCC